MAAIRDPKIATDPTDAGTLELQLETAVDIEPQGVRITIHPLGAP